MDLPRRASSELRSTHLVSIFRYPFKSNTYHSGQVAAVPATSVPLDTSIQALELALGALSERLAMTCTNPHLLDPSNVAATAEAIGKVAHALGQVKQLQHPGGTLSSLMS